MFDKKYQVLTSTQSIEQNRIDSAFLAFNDYRVPFGSGEPPPPLAYMGSDFMDSVRLAFEEHPGFQLSEDEQNVWQEFFDSDNPLEFVENLRIPYDFNYDVATAMRTLAYAERHRVDLGGVPRPDRPLATLTPADTAVRQERQQKALISIKEFARRIADGDPTARVNYYGGDFVERAREALANLAPRSQAEHFERYARVDISTLGTGEYKKAAADFNRVLKNSNKPLFKLDDLNKLERMIQIADGIRREGPLYPKQKLEPASRDNWRDRFEDVNSVASVTSFPGLDDG